MAALDGPFLSWIEAFMGRHRRGIMGPQELANLRKSLGTYSPSQIPPLIASTALAPLLKVVFLIEAGDEDGSARTCENAANFDWWDARDHKLML
jgi:hypothetical protein